MVGLVAFWAVPQLANAQSSKNKQNAAKDTLTVAFNGDPVSINPINSNDLWGLKVVNIVYSPLARTSNDGKVTYELAKSIEQSEDGRSILIKLRDDVKWSDGEPFTADDVVFTYSEKAKKENGKHESLWVGDQPIAPEKVDDYTVRFNLPEVSASAINNITNETYIIPKHVYQDVKDFSVNDLGKTPTVGTGPYVLESYKTGDSLKFKANEHYFKGKPKIEHVQAKIIPNKDTAKVALQKNEIDIANVNAADVADLGADINSETYQSGAIQYLGINTSIEKLKDVRVRQAIFYALNRQEINTAVYKSKDYYLEGASFLPADNEFYDKKTESYQQNIEKAKKLLKEAKAENLTLTLGYSSTDSIKAAEAVVIQQELQAVGIQVELIDGDENAILTELKKDGTTKYDLFLRAYSMGNDPDTYKRLFQTGGASNYFKYSSEEADKLFVQGATELDDSKRRDIYSQLQQQIASDALIYPIASDNGIVASTSRVQGIDRDNLYPIYTFGDWSQLSLKD